MRLPCPNEDVDPQTPATWTRRPERPSSGSSTSATAKEEGRAALRWPRWLRRLSGHLRASDERIVAGRNEEYPVPNESSDEEWWDRLVYGPPERCVAQIQRDADLGFTEFICWFDVGGLPHETVTRSMRRFAAEVMPAFTGRPAAVTS